MVLALKHRPKKFEQIIGQDAIVKTLTNSLSQNKLAHAYLFSGIRGSGKTTTARIFAKAMECENGPSPTPCEICENCKMANENSHMDIIEMDAASNRKIEDIRELIEHTKYKPGIGRYKIFIIDEVHMLTNEAFNALLKTLEEPPEYVKFILATTDPLKLPPTILSRVQHFRFNKIPESTIETYLQKILAEENVDFEPEALRLIVKNAKGSVRDSLTILDQAIAYSNANITLDKTVEMLGVLNPEIISKIFRLILDGNKKELKKIISQIKNYDMEFIIDEIILFLKETLFSGTLPIITLQRFFNIINDSKELIKLNSDNEFVLSLMFFRMIEATKPHKIDDLIKTMENKIDINAYKPQKSALNSPAPEKLFQILIQKITEKDLELGECFKNSLKFISFKDNILTWESCPDDKCKEMFKRYFSPVIRPLINEIFGLDVKINVIRCPKPKPKEKENPLKPKTNILNDKSEEVINKVREIFGSDVDITKINH